MWRQRGNPLRSPRIPSQAVHPDTHLAGAELSVTTGWPSPGQLTTAYLEIYPRPVNLSAGLSPALAGGVRSLDLDNHAAETARQAGQ